MQLVQKLASLTSRSRRTGSSIRSREYAAPFFEAMGHSRATGNTQSEYHYFPGEADGFVNRVTGGKRGYVMTSGVLPR